MKIVASSDWHLDWSTFGFDRFDDLMGQVERVKAAALEADAFLFLGDLCDPDTPGAHRAVRTACELASTLAKAGVVNIWVAGNHDVVEDGKGTTTLSALRGLELGGAVKKLVRVYEQPRAALIELVPSKVGGKPEKLAFVALPYPSRVNHYDTEEFASKLERPEGIPCLVGGHLWIDGAPSEGSESTEMARGRGVFWPVKELRESLGDVLLLGGHYHAPGWLGEVLIVGSLERLTAAEEHNKPRYLVLEGGAA